MATPAQGNPPPAQGAKDTSMSFASSSLYVGDLLPEITEANLCDVFNQVGPVQSIRVCRDHVTRRPLGYAYVNFRMMQDAERAIDTMNFSPIHGQPCRIMWSHRDPALRKSNKGNIFIKNLDKSIDNKMLYDTFSTFGNILSCKIAVDEENKSRGYGFVHYEDEESSQSAIEKVNGKMLKDKIVYVGPFKSRREREAEHGGPQEKVYSNIFVKNFDPSVTQEEFVELFSKFGTITSSVLKTFQGSVDRGQESSQYGFANFETAEAAKQAVEEMNDVEFKGRKIYVGPAERASQRRARLRAQFEKMKQEQIAKYQNVNLYIKNLDDDVTEEKLKEMFDPYGVITSVKLMTEGGVSKGFGFVCFTTPEEATKAVTEMNGKSFGSKPIYVSLAQRKEQRRAQLEAQMAQQYQQQQRMAPQGYYPGAMPAYYSQMNQYPYMNRQFGGKGGQQMYMGGGAMPGGGKGQRRNGKGKGDQGKGGKGAQRGPKGGMPGGKGPMAPNANPNSYAAKAQTQQSMPPPAQPQVVASEQPQPAPGLSQQLLEMPPEQQKQLLGEKLYPKVLAHKSVEERLAGKVTGMLLDMDIAELLNLYDDSNALHSKVIEAINVLAAHGYSKQVDPVSGEPVA